MEGNGSYKKFMYQTYNPATFNIYMDFKIIHLIFFNLTADNLVPIRYKMTCSSAIQICHSEEQGKWRDIS